MFEIKPFNIKSNGARKFFNRYLPMVLSVVLIVSAVFVYLVFHLPQFVGATGSGTSRGVIIQNAKICIGGCPYLTTISQVGTTATASHSGIGTATTVGIDTTGATLLVITVSGNNPCDSSTVTDSKSNTWHVSLVANLPDGDSNCIWYAYDKSGSPLVVGSGHTVSVNNAFVAITFSAWKGTLTGSDPLDAANSNNGNSGLTTVQPGSISPTYKNELVITTMAAGGGTAYTIDSPFTVGGSLLFSSGNFFGNAMAYSVQTDKTVANPTWSAGGSTTLGATIASFRAGTAYSAGGKVKIQPR